MKYISFAILLGLCLTGFASSKSHREMHSRDYYDEPEYQRTRQCQQNINSCAAPFISKYDTRDEYAALAIPLRIRLSGARAICRDGMKFRGCVKEKMNESVCQNGVSDYVRSNSEKLWRLGKKLCDDRIEDFAKHWHCILSLRVYTKLIKCQPHYGPDRYSCDINEIIDCVVNAYGSIPDCEAGATDFIREILPEVMNIGGPICPTGGPGGPRFSRSLQEFLKIK